MFTQLGKEKEVQRDTQESNGPKVFNSPPLPQETWTRKKRPRREPVFVQSKIVPEERYKPFVEAFHKASSTSSTGKNKEKEHEQVREERNVGVSKQPSVPSTKTFMGNIVTALDVEMISPNHFRFIDEPKPPDPKMKNHEAVICGAALTSTSQGEDHGSNAQEDLELKIVTVHHMET
ncbi:helicase [Sesbania bispinosa]|nr:helicase [Sesbania bispinosa]